MLQLQGALRLVEGAGALSCASKAGLVAAGRCICHWHSNDAVQSACPDQEQQQMHATQQQPTAHLQQQQQWQQEAVIPQPQHMPVQQQQHHLLQQQQQQQHQQLWGTRAIHTFTSSGSSAVRQQHQQHQQHQQQRSEQRLLSTQSGDAVGTSRLSAQLGERESLQQLDELLQVLMHPMPRAARWNAQLSPYLLQVNDQLLLQPQAVLLSVVRALHVIRAVLQENGQVYVVENHQLLRPLVKTAALSCINPNVWFDHRTWSPGTLTNYASAKRLFKESHQPNRRLFAAKGYSMVNPLLPRGDSGKMSPPLLQAPVPRLSQDDKWLLFKRSRKPGMKQLLLACLASEDRLHRFKPAGSLKGMPENLQLMVFLDSTKNAVAIKEAFNRNIPTIAIVNAANDMSHVTYPVLARDFSPAFVHFFLDWIIKVVNTPPSPPPGSQGASGRQGRRN